MKKTDILRLFLALIGFLLLVIAFILILLGAYYEKEQFLYISFIFLFSGLSFMTYIVAFLIVKYIKARK